MSKLLGAVRGGQGDAEAAVAKLREQYPDKQFSYVNDGTKFKVQLDDAQGTTVVEMDKMARVVAETGRGGVATGEDAPAGNPDGDKVGDGGGTSPGSAPRASGAASGTSASGAATGTGSAGTGTSDSGASRSDTGPG